MKKHFYLTALIALLFVTFNVSTAKSAEKEQQEKEQEKSPATCLPINSNVIFLMVAGLSIGIFAVTKRKSLKTN